MNFVKTFMGYFVRAARSDSFALFAFSISLLATLLVLTMKENSWQVRSWIALYGIIVISLQIFAYAVARRTFLPEPLSILLLGALAAFNNFSFYVVHLNQGAPTHLIYSLITAGMFVLLLKATSQLMLLRTIGVIALCLTPIASLFTASTGQLPTNNAQLLTSKNLEEYSKIRFRDKPNIYLLSFDALLPSSTAKKFFGLSTLAYEKTLTEKGALLLENAFVSQAPSIPSLNAVMKLDDADNYKGDGYYSGRRPSPITAMLKQNGYYVETGTSLPHYFGRSGSFVDKHVSKSTNLIADSSLCKFASEAASLWGTLGFCNLRVFLTTSKLFDLEPVLKDAKSPYFDSAWHQYVISQIKAGVSGPPKFRFYYYYYPIGHASNDFISFDKGMMKAYGERLEIQATKAAEVFRELSDSILQFDPNSIVLIFGDHGTKISRTAGWQQHTEFWVQDNHAVSMAILKTENVCARPDLTRYNQKYYTAGRVVASIFRCISENPDKLDAMVNFRDKFDFEKYLVK